MKLYFEMTRRNHEKAICYFWHRYISICILGCLYIRG
jgi:hypothetical protein